MKRKIHWGHIAEFTLTVISAVLFIWFVASFIDVNMHNDFFSANYGQFAKWNLFLLLFG